MANETKKRAAPRVRNTGSKASPKSTTAQAKAVEAKKKTTPAPKQYGQNDLIPCVNYWAGAVMMRGRKTKTDYTWDDQGDVAFVEYQDLNAEMLNGMSAYIYDPIIVIEDEEVYANRPKIKKLYENLYSVEEIQQTILSGDLKKISAMLKTMPEGATKTASHIFATLIEDGYIDSVRVAKAFDNELGTSFVLMLE